MTQPTSYAGDPQLSNNGRGSSTHRLYIRYLKRISDIVASATGIVLLSPLFILIAGINRAIGSDVLFRKVAIGQGLEPIRVYKFVTMVKNARELGGTITLKDDPRVTSFGKFLRRTKLDELPQLFNVLKGDMSLVGPRPLSLDKKSHYSGNAARVYSVRPGITGIGSLLFHDESATLPGDQKSAEAFYVNSILRHKIDLELWYVNHRSFGLDFRILLNTLINLYFSRNVNLVGDPVADSMGMGISANGSGDRHPKSSEFPTQGDLASTTGRSSSTSSG